MSRTLKFLCFLFTDADSMLSYCDISGVSELHQLSRRIHRYKRSDESWPVTSWKRFFLCKVIKVIHFWIFLSLVGGQCVILMSSLLDVLFRLLLYHQLKSLQHIRKCLKSIGSYSKRQLHHSDSCCAAVY